MIKQISNNRTMFFSLAICLALFQGYVALSSPQVPYMDTMLFLVQIDQILKGEISWFDAYGANVHRGLIYPVVTLIEWVLWGLDSRITTVLTGFVVTAIFFYWLRAFLASNRAENTRPVSALGALCISVFSAIIIASPAAFELWTLDLGFAQLLKNLLIVVFLFHITTKKQWTKNTASALAFGALGGFLILFATYGWSYPFFAATSFGLVACSLKAVEDRKNAVVVFAVLLTAQALYVYAGSGVFSSSESMSSDNFSVAGFFGAVFYGAGTVFVGDEAIAKLGIPLFLPIVLGVFVAVVGGLAIVVTLIEQSPAKIFLCSLLVFSFTVLAGIAVARGGVDFTNAGASRYFVDFIWLLLSPLAILLTTNVHRLFGQYKFIDVLPLGAILNISKVAITGLFVCAILGHLATWVVEFKTAPYRALVFEKMASVYRFGVASETDAALLQSPYPIAKKGVEVAQFYNLAILRREQLGCSLSSAAYAGDWYPAEKNNTRWLKQEGTITVNNCPVNLNIRGYIPEGFNQKNITAFYGQQQKSVSVEPDKEFSIVLEDLKPGRISIRLHVDETTIPLLNNLNADGRELGILLTYVGE